jgi:hypothetical protein
MNMDHWPVILNESSSSCNAGVVDDARIVPAELLAWGIVLRAVPENDHPTSKSDASSCFRVSAGQMSRKSRKLGAVVSREFLDKRVQSLADLP